MEEVTKEVCGAVAAQHRRQIETLILQPVAELFLCPFDKSKFWLPLLCGRSELPMRFSDDFGRARGGGGGGAEIWLISMDRCHGKCIDLVVGITTTQILIIRNRNRQHMDSCMSHQTDLSPLEIYVLIPN